MPFKKNDPQSKKWQSLGGKTQVANRRKAIDQLIDNWRTGFAEEYERLQGILATGVALSKPQQEFCDRYEKMINYAVGKQAPVDKKGATAQPMVQVFGMSHKELDNE